MAKKEIINHYLTKETLKTDQQVYEFVTALGAPILGTKVNCRQPDHTSPFRAVSDIITTRVNNYIVWANRGGSKTYAVGGFPTWYRSIRNPFMQTRILGGSESQSKLGYEAMRDFFRITDTEDTYLKPPGLMKTSANFINGSEVAILTASTKSVRGPHPQVLLLDEVDEMDEEVYESALSQPQTRYGISASMGIFSTNHQVAGLMDVAVARALDQGYPVDKYCIWECLESCRDYDCPCKLAPWCPGPHMREANGYYKIKDFIDKLSLLAVSTLERDWFCVKRGLGDLVYEQEYDPRINDVGIPLRLDAPVDISIDFGGTDPFSIGVWQDIPDTDPRFPPGSVVRVTELYILSKDKSLHNGIVIREAMKRPWWKLIKNVIPDVGRPDLIAEWREALPGADFHTEEKKEIEMGVERVKAVLSPAEGLPTLYINRICTNCKREFQQYGLRKITDNSYKIMDKFNHAMDDMRYYVLWKFGQGEESFFGAARHDQLPTN